MSSEAPLSTSDAWYDWLLFRRDGNTSSIAARSTAEIDRYVDQVLDSARVRANSIVVDLGSGTGVVGLRAIERFGASLRIIMVDSSQPLLEFARQAATGRGVMQQCEFLRASADHVPSIADQSVDAVTSRAALAYVTDKQAAFEGALRILKPGAWLSICEPIMQDDALPILALKHRLDGADDGPERRVLELLHRFKSSQYPDTAAALAENPLTNFTERDLVTMAVDAGFVDVHMELHIDIAPACAVSWETFLQGSPHPLAPTCGEILEQRFSVEERLWIEQLVRPGLELGKTSPTTRVAYLSCRKPLEDR